MGSILSICQHSNMKSAKMFELLNKKELSISHPNRKILNHITISTTKQTLTKTLIFITHKNLKVDR